MLVVDDEPNVRATLHDALELEGYQVTLATNGSDGLALIAAARPDIIVLDLWMPGMDGWEFRRLQLDRHPGIPVVVLSALNMSDPRLEELRADALIGKPFDLDHLYAAIAGALQSAS